MPDIRIHCDPAPSPLDLLADATLACVDVALAADTVDLSDDLDDLEPAAGDEVRT